MKSLRTALHLLAQFTGEKADFGVGELAEATGMPKSQVSKMLSAFRDSGLVTQDPKTRRYHVGVRAFVLGSRYVNFDPVTREAMPIMRAIVAESGHSARLSVMDGDDAFYLVGVEGPLFVDTGWRGGTVLPLHATSGGRTLISHLDEARVDALLDLHGMPRITERTVTDRAELKAILARARRLGWTSQRGETTSGLGTVAVPIFGEGRQGVGALGFAFPAHVIGPERDPELAEMLHRHARVLSQRLGSSVYPYGGKGHGGRGAGEPVGAAAQEATAGT